MVILPATTVISASRCSPPRPSIRSPARMVTGAGSGTERQAAAAMASEAPSKRNARLPGRFLSEWSRLRGLGSNRIADGAHRGTQRQLGERGFFPEHRYHELLLHNTSRGVLHPYDGARG